MQETQHDVMVLGNRHLQYLGLNGEALVIGIIPLQKGPQRTLYISLLYKYTERN